MTPGFATWSMYTPNGGGTNKNVLLLNIIGGINGRKHHDADAYHLVVNRLQEADCRICDTMTSLNIAKQGMRHRLP